MLLVRLALGDLIGDTRDTDDLTGVVMDRIGALGNPA